MNHCLIQAVINGAPQMRYTKDNKTPIAEMTVNFKGLRDKVKKHPDLYKKITSSGNSIGNHSMTHPMGWGKSKKVYLNDVHEAEKLINSNLFRPPYGKINFKSNKALQQKYKIIMWDVVGKPTEKIITGKDCTGIITERPGGVAFNVAVGLSKTLSEHNFELNLVSAIGKNEKNDQTVSMRRIGSTDTNVLKLADAINEIVKEIKI